MESCTKKRANGETCGSYAVNEHRGSERCDRCWQEDRAEAAEARVIELEHAIRAMLTHPHDALPTVAKLQDWDFAKSLLN